MGNVDSGIGFNEKSDSLAPIAKPPSTVESVVILSPVPLWTFVAVVSNRQGYASDKKIGTQRAARPSLSVF